MSSFDIAQICLNGHVINDTYVKYPETNQKYCDKCGEKTIISCQNCHTDIRGYQYFENVIRMSMVEPPSFCHECGKPYPWTEEKMAAAMELADLLDELTEQEKDDLKKSLDELVKDGPRTVVAATKFKRILSKTGPEIATGFKDILVAVVSETVKKSIWG
ncbi:DUF2321 domain-containing protein [Cytobacillus solani]|uniref:DUF2321 domain-containing protein n=1 Tax=Cytobacillus solani TaxID=1637975 RepID=UPI0011517F13|nr:DUF2321 domain-containing protein [Cytobacillus solani]